MLGFHQHVVHVRTAVAEKLPSFAHLGNHFEIEIGGEDFVLVTRGLGKNLAARITEIAGTVKFADIPGSFGADAVNRSNEITIGCGMGGLLQLPEVFAESSDGSRGIKDDFRSVQPEGASAFGKVPVVADIHADFREAEIKDGIAQIAGAEIKFFPKTGSDMGDVRLTIFANIGAVTANDSCCVVVDSFAVDFVNRDDDCDAEFAG